MKALQIAQIILSVVLMLAILMQSRGAGLGGVFGGSSNVYLAKRGAEKALFVLTIILAVLFFSVSLISVII